MLARENKFLALELINGILKEIKSRKKQTLEDQKLVATLMNCLSKSSPNVEINSLSFSNTKGMTPQELIYEFKRLKALSEGATSRAEV